MQEELRFLTVCARNQRIRSYLRQLLWERHLERSSSPRLSTQSQCVEDIVIACQSVKEQAPTSLFWLTRRVARYESLLERVVWPKTSSFMVYGSVFDLPLRQEIPPNFPDHVDPQRLRFLAGFFAGAGSVSVLPGHHSCRLAVSQSADDAEILHEFLSTFGGGICAHQSGEGLSRPTLEWKISGKAGQRAAEVLAAVPSKKHLLLTLAARWPRDKLGIKLKSFYDFVHFFLCKTYCDLKIKTESKRIKSIFFFDLFYASSHLTFSN